MKHTATAPPAYPSRRRGGRRFAMDYHRGDTLVAQRTYTYDQLGRPTTRTITRQGSTRTDAYTYNNRSELIGDIVDGTGLNGWDYDNIGNRRMENRSDGYEIYTANNLNQYTAIEDQEGTFQPAYDDDGNQTRIKTSTGIWDVTYNAKNRPVLFSKEGEDLTVACTYDYMGRRATKKVTENGTVTLHQRYLYRGYLQIDSPPPHRRLTPAGQHRSAGCPPGLTAVGRVACCDLLRPAHPCIWLITWDPTQEIATRPLAIQKDGTWYTYGWDLTKNVWEVYGATCYIGTAYTYTAYGQVTASGAVEQPIQWSSEYNDTELALVYYNYRHYNPVDGRWIGRDFDSRRIKSNTYVFAKNSFSFDFLGLMAPGGIEAQAVANSGNNFGKGNATIGLKTKREYDNSPCKVYICCKTVAGSIYGGHCVILLKYSNGKVRGCRGGPSRNGNSGGFSGSSGSSNLGFGSSGSSASSGNASNSHNPKCKGCCGYWGNVVAGCGDEETSTSNDALMKGIREDLKSAREEPSSCNFVKGYTDEECKKKEECLHSFMQEITDKCYIYTPIGNNSNTSWKTSFAKCFGNVAMINPPGFQPGNAKFDNKTCSK